MSTQTQSMRRFDGISLNLLSMLLIFTLCRWLNAAVTFNSKDLGAGAGGLAG